MKKYLFKVLFFIVVIGILILIGSREMKRRGINQKNFSVDDLVDVYEANNLLGTLQYAEVQIFEENPKDADSYKEVVKVDEKNDLYLLRNELNNSRQLTQDEITPGGDYEGCALVTLYLNDGTKLYCGINQFYEGNNMFFIAKEMDLGDKINYITLSEDDVYEYVEDLYKKYANNNTNANTNTNTNTNTSSTTNSNISNSVNTKKQ